MVKTASKWQARQPIYKRSVERWRRFWELLPCAGSPDRASA
jgi:hypothetical protein